MSFTRNSIAKLIRDRALHLLLIVFILVQLALFLRIGVFTDLEAQKYILEGNFLFDHGHLNESKYVFYLPVILLVYLCRAIGCSYGLVVIVQVLLSGLAAYYFYYLAMRIGNNTIAFFATLLLLLFVPLQTWNFYLYSDSIFISLGILYTCLIARQTDRGIKGSLLIIGFLCLLLVARPHGLLFIPPTIIFLLFKRQPRKQLFANLALCLVLLAGMYIFLNAAFTGGGDMDAMKPFIEEHIICFVPMKPGGADLQLIHTASPVNDIFYYIFHNPFHFMKLMGLRLLSFFNITRSYYTTAHNIFLLLYIIPVYLFALMGLRRCWAISRNFSTFLFALLILYPVGATFQCDDWHSRFTMVIFPYLILLACLGAYHLFMKKQSAAA